MDHEQIAHELSLMILGRMKPSAGTLKDTKKAAVWVAKNYQSLHLDIQKKLAENKPPLPVA